jgi:hypothetical protein
LLQCITSTSGWCLKWISDSNIPIGTQHGYRLLN